MEKRLDDLERKVLRIMVNQSKLASKQLSIDKLCRYTGKREGRVRHVLIVLEQAGFITVTSQLPLRYRVLREFETPRYGWERLKGHR
jgi:predicted transcriptional regulator